MADDPRERCHFSDPFPNVCTDSCKLLREMLNNSQHGGHTNPDGTGGDGPYFRRPQWDALAEHVRQLAKAACAEADATISGTQAETTRKENATPSEIIDIP